MKTRTLGYWAVALTALDFAMSVGYIMSHSFDKVPGLYYIS